MNDRVARETRAIYARADAAWSRFSCPGTSECCQLSKTQRQPWLWPSEWRVLKGDEPLPPPRADGACPFLSADDRCSRYADRPLGCRTFFCHRIRGPSRHPIEEMDALSSRLARINLEEDEAAEPKQLLELFSP